MTEMDEAAQEIKDLGLCVSCNGRGYKWVHSARHLILGHLDTNAPPPRRSACLSCGGKGLATVD